MKPFSSSLAPILWFLISSSVCQVPHILLNEDYYILAMPQGGRRTNKKRLIKRPEKMRNLSLFGCKLSEQEIWKRTVECGGLIQTFPSWRQDFIKQILSAVLSLSSVATTSVTSQSSPQPVSRMFKTKSTQIKTRQRQRESCQQMSNFQVTNIVLRLYLHCAM